MTRGDRHVRRGRRRGAGVQARGHARPGIGRRRFERQGGEGLAPAKGRAPARIAGIRHAQGLLGDLVYVELPNVGDRVEAGNASAVVESVKAASDVYSPVSGTVLVVNAALADKPETINEDAYGDGWLFVVQIDEPDQLNEMLDPDAYAELLEEDDH